MRTSDTVGAGATVARARLAPILPRFRFRSCRRVRGVETQPQQPGTGTEGEQNSPRSEIGANVPDRDAWPEQQRPVGGDAAVRAIGVPAAEFVGAP
jgi:hypothetical protein